MAEQRTHRYHLISSPTKAWHEFVQAVREHADRAADERAARDEAEKRSAIWREEHHP